MNKAESNSQLLQKVAEVYDWLDLQINNNSNITGKCDACGRCCNFEGPDPDSEQGFDHRLFVTPPEVIYLAAKLGVKSLKPMPTSRCPYNIDGKCSVYKYRFAGCRIFYCKGNRDFQSELSESALKKFKMICEESGIAYRYIDLATALSSD